MRIVHQRDSFVAIVKHFLDCQAYLRGPHIAFRLREKIIWDPGRIELGKDFIP
jgi:hypothetical protein